MLVKSHQCRDRFCEGTVKVRNAGGENYDILIITVPKKMAASRDIKEGSIVSFRPNPLNSQELILAKTGQV